MGGEFGQRAINVLAKRCLTPRGRWAGALFQKSDSGPSNGGIRLLTDYVGDSDRNGRRVGIVDSRQALHCPQSCRTEVAGQGLERDRAPVREILKLRPPVIQVVAVL